MVLESFLSPINAAKKPWHMFFIGFLYAVISAFLAIWIFRQHASLVMVFLTVIAAVPMMYSTMKKEEEADVTLSNEGEIMKEHFVVLKYLVYMFLGFVVAYSLLFIILPLELVNNLFFTQTETIQAINGRLMGYVIGPSSIFGQIFFNNLKVLMFCLFFSFFYGAGAIFILTWNASVISAAIGDFVRNKIAAIASALGSVNVFNYFHAFSLGLVRYFIHGIPEIAAYFVGGLAGGVISVAMINHDIETNKFKVIMIDALDLTLLAIGILFIAALLEVFVTPVFF